MTWRALPAMAVPFVVLVGIYGGFMTITESAALAAVTALIVSVGVYRGFPVSRTLEVIAEALRSAGVDHADHRDRAGVRPLDDRLRHSWATGRLRRASRLRHLGVPADDQRAAADHRLLPGSGGTLLLVMPILAPVLLPLGVDPVHFGIIFTHNMEVGLVHPPVGLNLYVLSTISDAPVGEVIRGILPFLIFLLIVLGDHHLCAGTDAVVATGRVQVPMS